MGQSPIDIGTSQISSQTVETDDTDSEVFQVLAGGRYQNSVRNNVRNFERLAAIHGSIYAN